jgi:DNA invertase Pin-like site-specific DNA recombinase
MTKLGYARCSTQGQELDAQVARLTAAGCERVFSDHGQSGRKAHRPQWDELRKYVRKGDVIVCTKLDRLGRSVHDLVVLAAELKEAGIGLEVLDQQIDTSTLGGRILFHVLCILAEVEADLIAERTRDALEFKRSRGIVGGRDFKLTSAQVATVRQLYDQGHLTVAQIGEQFGVSRQTIYRVLKDESARLSERDAQRKQRHKALA